MLHNSKVKLIFDNGSTYTSSDEDATNTKCCGGGLTSLLLTGSLVTENVAGGGIGGPLGPRPSASKISSTVGKPAAMIW